MPCVTAELQPNEMQSELQDITSQLTQHISECAVLRFLSPSDDNWVYDQQAEQPATCLILSDLTIVYQCYYRKSDALEFIAKQQLW